MPASKNQNTNGLMHRTKTGQCSITASARVRVGSFGQPRFPKPLDQQLRMCLSAPTHPRGYCEGGIDLKHTRRRLTRFGITSEMGESGRETVASSRIGGVMTLSLLPCDDGLVKAAKLNESDPYPG
jgi:hypothetical protein